MVPGKPEPTILVGADSYSVSTSQGAPLVFNLDYGYVDGNVSFKYGDYNGKQNIFVTYAAILPYAGDLEDTINIAPM